jgi:hypothetical protein
MPVPSEKRLNAAADGSGALYVAIAAAEIWPLSVSVQLNVADCVPIEEIVL